MMRSSEGEHSEGKGCAIYFFVAIVAIIIIAVVLILI
jgi:hypothetical protein